MLVAGFRVYGVKGLESGIWEFRGLQGFKVLGTVLQLGVSGLGQNSRVFRGLRFRPLG